MFLSVACVINVVLLVFACKLQLQISFFFSFYFSHSSRNMSNHPDFEHFFSKKETRISKSLLGEIKNELFIYFLSI